MCQTPKYATNRTILNQDLLDEIEFRANCKQDTQVTTTPLPLIRCNSTVDDLPLRKAPLGLSLGRNEVSYVTFPEASDFNQIIVPIAAGTDREFKALSTDGNNGSLSKLHSPCTHLTLMLSITVKLLISN